MNASDGLQRNWKLNPVFLPGESHGQRSLAGYSPWGQKVLDITERLVHIHINTQRGFPAGAMVKNPPANAGDARDLGSILGLRRPVEEEMATHSSILAWRIPWTEEPGRL